MIKVDCITIRIRTIRLQMMLVQMVEEIRPPTIISTTITTTEIHSITMPTEIEIQIPIQIREIRIMVTQIVRTMEKHDDNRDLLFKMGGSTITDNDLLI